MSQHVTAQCVVLVGLKAPAPRSPLLLVGPEEDYRHGTRGDGEPRGIFIWAGGKSRVKPPFFLAVTRG